MWKFELRRKTEFRAPINDVFTFFESPKNLVTITPPSLNFRMLTPEPLVMKEGAVFDYLVRPFGLPIRWRSVISDYKPPHQFVDVQVKGPYALWHHTHSFRKTPHGTEMEDVVRYALPFGPFGLLALPLVRRQLDDIFDYRERAIARLFP